jgi:hypothetical protein
MDKVQKYNSFKSLEKLIVIQLVKKFPGFMEPEVSVPCSQDPTTGPYPGLAQIISCIIALYDLLKLFDIRICGSYGIECCARFEVFSAMKQLETRKALRNVGILPQHYTQRNILIAIAVFKV